MQIMSNPTHEDIKKAAKALKNGQLVAFPTETVYGLGADATNENAVSRIYSVKGRPIDHPLIVHISSVNLLEKWAVEIPEYAIKLAKEFWPGPMTLILKRSELAKDFITGGQDSVGLRVPDQSLTLDLLNEFMKLGGLGIAAPSANRFGAVSPTTADAVKDELGSFLKSDDLILNGGPCSVGIESTIIDCTKNFPVIIRQGFITLEMVNRILLLKVTLSSFPINLKVSGSFESHYSPEAQVLLDTDAMTGDGFIAMSKISTPEGAIRLASPKSIEEFARILYSSFRLGDQLELKKIVVVCPSGDGLANAINERLLKSSYKK